MAFKMKGIMGMLGMNSKVKSWLKEREGGEASTIQVVPEEYSPESSVLSYSTKFRKKRNKLKK
jgi:hypothetical protein